MDERTESLFFFALARAILNNNKQQHTVLTDRVNFKYTGLLACIRLEGPFMWEPVRIRVDRTQQQRYFELASPCMWFTHNYYSKNYISNYV